MKNHFLFTALIISLLVVFSCGKQSVRTTDAITYVYTQDSLGNTVADSLKLYSTLPFEKSLEFYKNTNNITKEVQFLVYLKIFKIDNQKFAILADSAYTNFYKFMPDSQYKKQIGMIQAMGIRAKTEIKDLNHDGYPDIVYRMSSGGSYGEDTTLIFYDPKKKNLVYNEEPLLRDAEIVGDTVNSYTKFLYKKYLIKGFKLHLTEDTEFLQGENDSKKVVRHYNANAKEISRDTLIIQE